jgi:CRISPR/Cas system Type II protein with McrA/HNH and RuvC-like nuclease domain
VTEASRTEVRDGKIFRVTVLPEQGPPSVRSKKTKLGRNAKRRIRRRSARIQPSAKFPFVAVINGREATVYGIGDIRYE